MKVCITETQVVEGPKYILLEQLVSEIRKPYKKNPTKNSKNMQFWMDYYGFVKSSSLLYIVVVN